MPVDLVTQNRVLALQTKVDLLAWVGLIPGQAGEFTKLEVRKIKDALINPETSAEDAQEAQYKLNQGDPVMDLGLKTIIQKLETEECLNCGKCDNLKDVAMMLINKDPLHEIHEKIQICFGDISTVDAGMPGHQEDMMHSSQNPTDRLLALAKMIRNLVNPSEKDPNEFFQTAQPPSDKKKLH